MTGDLRRVVASYYADKLAAHGPTPAGVDWNGEASQHLRFEQLLRIVDRDTGTLLDYGCGYGALADVAARRHPGLRYQGFDIAPEMVEAARRLHPDLELTSDPDRLEPADFTVASGIFNVRLDHDPDVWQAYVEETLDTLAGLTRRGLAFNMLTSYSDPERMRDDLHYADPRAVFDHCKRRLSPHVAILHDYGLYEFTVLVRLEVS
ncbi:MAG TPA: methyltransferase domain-containing protein [Capillimicrobium sp.]|nr:methyltransferase domain-containing protein [Capillimicrobium sp.]